jgi:Stress responsive A/B Barrel Domain
MIQSRSLRVLALGLLVAGTLTAGIVIGQNKFGTPSTVVHVVTVKWKADSSSEQRARAISGVKDMAAAIPGIRNVWVKTLKVQGPSQDKPFDAAFVMEFENEAALKGYADHSAHKQWESLYTAIREESRSHDITN